MKISVFAEDDYSRSVFKELEQDYDILYDSVTPETDVTFCMCAPSTYRFFKYMQNEQELNKVEYKTKLVCNVLDIPYWRIEDAQWKRYYDNYKLFLSVADKITCISNFTKDMVKDLWKMDADVLFTQFNNKPIDESLRIMEEDEKLIIGCSRCVPHKRYEMVIKALEGTDYKFKLITRGGPVLGIYTQMAKDYGVDFEVLMDITDDEKIAWYKKARLVVHPSEFEGYSLVPKEALWCDTPVVLSDIPTHKEYHDDNSVRFFETNNVESLKAAIDAPTIAPDSRYIEHLTVEVTAIKVQKWIEDFMNNED